MTNINQSRTSRMLCRFHCLPHTIALPAMLAVVLLIAACDQDVERAPVSDSWQRIDASGNPAEGSEEHHCVLDQRTGLLWEVKRPDNGPHRFDARYSWYEPERQRNMSDPGLRDGGECDLERCDTHALIEAVNQRGLCGYSDWRLPTREELLTLGDYQLIETGNVLDPEYFPLAPAGEYWSASTFRLYPQSAWLVSTRTGLDRAELKTESRFVRLVRGEVFDPRKPRDD